MSQAANETALAPHLGLTSVATVTAALITKAKREAAKPGFGAAPILLTQLGKPKAYLLEAKSFEAMQRRLSILEGIALGEADVRQGRVVSHAEAGKRLARWLK